MGTQRIDELETEIEDYLIPERVNEISLNIKLERRRRIEQIVEEKRLREELEEFNLA